MKKCINVFSLCIFASLLSSVAWAMNKQEGEGAPVKIDGEQAGEKDKRPTVNPLSQSIIIQSSGATQSAYEETSLILKSDTTKPRIYWIVDKNNSYNWEALVNRGYQLNGFTEQDLQWVVNEFSVPYKLDKDESKTLFDLMITKQFGGHYEQNVIDLLTAAKLVVEDSALSSWTARTRKARVSVIVHAIEQAKHATRYLDALKNILALLPIADINTRNMVVREEYNPEKGEGYFDFQYDEKTYSLLGWLTRTHKNVPALYLDRNHKRRLYYVGAAKHLMERNLANQIREGERDIDADLFDMITLLRKQDDIEKGQFEEAARRLKLK